jgi:hypothetical protein
MLVGLHGGNSPFAAPPVAIVPAHEDNRRDRPEPKLLFVIGARFPQDAESGADRLDAVWPPTLVTFTVEPRKYRAKIPAVDRNT